jgi:hypothetical protein
LFYPTRGVFASTELNVHVVSTINVNDEDSLKGVCRRARGVLVTDVEAET